MVDFIGIGAQKAGTSWVYACLYEHPEICAPIKEIHFFSRSRFTKGREWYDRIKAGDAGADIGAQMQELAASQVDSGAEAIIVGCTEIPLVLTQANCIVPLLSSTDLLVEKTIELACGGPLE